MREFVLAGIPFPKCSTPALAQFAAGTVTAINTEGVPPETAVDVAKRYALRLIAERVQPRK